jgi:glycosyltransferase involved in cell wall biosynthesis
MKKLTIAFPVYNDNKLLDRALEGISNQTFKDFRVVLIDDKSPTTYEDIISKWSNEFEISIIHNDNNLGAMDNIWKSIHINVETPYLMSHHSDDFLKINYLEKAIYALENHPTASFAITGPDWITAETPYRKEIIVTDKVDLFDASDFAKNSLKFAPYMFGSVVYRTKDITNDWRYPDFDTYCDRYFLGKILVDNNTFGVFIHGNGIMERDHSSDLSDTRSTKLNENHAINLMSFYRDLLLIKYTEKEVNEIITNNTIYYFGNFTKRSSFINFYKKQKSKNLIKIKSIRILGLLAFLSLSISYKNKLKINSFIKKFKK